jgi:hypothetical protein
LVLKKCRPKIEGKTEKWNNGKVERRKNGMEGWSK